MGKYILTLHSKLTVTCFSHTSAYCNVFFRQFDIEYLFINVAGPDTLSLSSTIEINLISTYFTFQNKTYEQMSDAAMGSS